MFLSGLGGNATVRVDWLSREPVVGVLHEDDTCWLVHQVLMSSLELATHYDHLRDDRRLVPVNVGRFKKQTVAGIRLVFIELEAA